MAVYLNWKFVFEYKYGKAMYLFLFGRVVFGPKMCIEFDSTRVGVSSTV